MKSVSIIDYGMGNIYSISNAVRNLGWEAKVIHTPADLASSDKAILPGVGAYRDAMKVLNGMGMCRALVEHAQSGKPLLGICLGMQLLLESSEENGGVDGLGIVRGAVRRFPSDAGYKIPQIQWNAVSWRSEMAMFDDIADDSMFYFLHSYYCLPEADGLIGAHSNYAGSDYCSAFHHNNIWATQFHPEKSSRAGLQLLSNFLTQE
jgi:imidazole glycerol-phosphate synthase subunit HisH